MAGRYWREAASLILVCRAAKTKILGPNDSDFRLLFLKRSHESSFMPNAFVFPGGIIEPSDFSEEWIDIFEKHGHSQSQFLKEFRTSATLPELYKHKRQGPILPEVGFRISAIREAFEESGILLASYPQNNHLTQQDINHWRKVVHDDATQFLTLFQELGGYPAVQDLYEWNCWLTPSGVGNRRFDTAFYIAFVDEMPRAVSDQKEIVDLKVASPWNILQQSRKGTVFLPPPQVYEISRIAGFQSFDELHNFAKDRGKKGLDHYYGVRIIVENGIVSVLPGDDLYPENPDYEGRGEPQNLTTTIEQLQESATNLNRIEIRSPTDIRCVVNIKLKYGHIKPINVVNLLGDSKL